MSNGITISSTAKGNVVWPTKPTLVRQAQTQQWSIVKGSEGGLKYKVHYSADLKTRIITDCYTTAGSSQEGHILPGRIDYMGDEMGFDIQEIIADRGNGRGPTYSALRERKIRAYIPLHDTRLGKGKLTPTEFTYHSGTDRYQCPEGYFLYPYEKLDHGLIKRYRITGGHCRHCPRLADCLPESAKNRARFVYRSPHQHPHPHPHQHQHQHQHEID